MRSIHALVRRVYVYVCTTAIVVCCMVALVAMREYAITHGEWGRVHVFMPFLMVYYVLYRTVTYWR